MRWDVQAQSEDVPSEPAQAQAQMSWTEGVERLHEALKQATDTLDEISRGFNAKRAQFFEHD